MIDTETGECQYTFAALATLPIFALGKTDNVGILHFLVTVMSVTSVLAVIVFTTPRTCSCRLYVSSRSDRLIC